MLNLYNKLHLPDSAAICSPRKSLDESHTRVHTVELPEVDVILDALHLLLDLQAMWPNILRVV